MVGVPADSLVSLASNAKDYIPEQIKRLYGAKYDFKISVPRGVVRRGRTSFRVDSFKKIADLEEHSIPQTEICMYLTLLRKFYFCFMVEPECHLS